MKFERIILEGEKKIELVGIIAVCLFGLSILEILYIEPENSKKVYIKKILKEKIELKRENLMKTY